MPKNLFSRGRAYFLTGFAVLLPALITLALVKWIFISIASITDYGLTTSYITYGDGTNTPVGWFEYTKRTHSATYGSAELRHTVRYGASIAATPSTAGFLVNPRPASVAARSPFADAFPACNGLHIVPNIDLSPAACAPAMPRACSHCSSLNPIRWAHAAAAPNVPSVPVAWKPVL